MEYVDGVIDGYHDFANALSIPGGVASREELEAMRHHMKFWLSLPDKWNDKQRSDWADGYISGYNVRRNR
jgi:hypothetical protein